jgi:anti-sigma regulatory factor (Ser/Thr protein kinase)
MQRSERHFIEPDRGAPAGARRFVTATLQGWDTAARLDDALLLTSELVSNAVEYGASPASLDISYDATVLRISVRDAGPGRPVLGRLDNPHSGQGRGIALVNAVADDWGVEVTDERGKAVWFTLSGVDGA